MDAVAREFTFCLMHSHNYPYAFSSFLSTDPAVKQRAGELAMSIFDLIQWLAESEGGDSLLEVLHWPRTPFCKDILLSIAECEGGCPADTLGTIEDMSLYKGTELIECMFNQARRTMSVDAVGRY